MWACGRVVLSKYERPSIFHFNTHSVLCCGLVAVWDGPKKIQMFFIIINEWIVMWACDLSLYSLMARVSSCTLAPSHSPLLS
jgi:hypothetical protein